LQLGFFRSFIREFLSLFLSIFTLQISMLVLLISKRDQTLHDKICRTYVIRTAHWTPGRKKLVALTSIIILFLDILLLYAVLHK